MGPETLPENTALVVIDAQNAFLADDGSFIRRGYHIHRLDELKQAILAAVRLFRRQERPVICTKMEIMSTYADAGLLVRHKHPVIADMGAYQQGTHDAALFEELNGELGKGVWVVSKSRYDPFMSQDFAQLVDQIKIRQFVVAGVLTNVCVESFVRSAFDRDYPVTVIADATRSYSLDLQAASLRTLQKHFAEVITLEHLVSKGVRKLSDAAAYERKE